MILALYENFTILSILSMLSFFSQVYGFLRYLGCFAKSEVSWQLKLLLFFYRYDHVWLLIDSQWLFCFNVATIFLCCQRLTIYDKLFLFLQYCSSYVFLSFFVKRNTPILLNREWMDILVRSCSLFFQNSLIKTQKGIQQ